MAYFPDLTSYSYFPLEIEQENTLNVGWLSSEYEFPTGSVDEAFTERLWLLCAYRLRQTRGFHLCPFCKHQSRPLHPLTVTHQESELLLGTAEIRVSGEDGKIYAAPDLIIHYVVSHKYRPPDEFIAAVLSASPPHSSSYKAFLRRIGLDEEPIGIGH